MPRPKTIAIDGPVAAGKDTVGKEVATRLGYRFLDTGVMYRALTWLAIKKGVSLDDERALDRLAAGAHIEVGGTDGASLSSVLINGHDATQAIRGTEVERGVSLVARMAGVREVMVAQQRQLAAGGSIVVTGRDIGTVVLPDADLKVFLVASPEVRARRRFQQMQEQGREAHYEEVLDDLRRRDQLDSGRAVAPLRPATDALVIDTDGLDVEQVTEKIIAVVEGP